MKIQIVPEIRLTEFAKSVDGNRMFEHALTFFISSKVQHTVFEPYLYVDDTDKLITDAFGARIPKRIQFSISGSTVTVKAEYGPFLQAENGFFLEMHMDCYYANMFMNKLEAFMTVDDNGKIEVHYYCKDSIESFKNELKKGLIFFATPEVQKLQNHGNETIIEATCALLCNYIVNFLVDIPGRTDGPNHDASREEIEKFLANRSKQK